MIRRVVLGTALGLILVASASASTRIPSFYGCSNTGAAVRPKTIVMACGDSSYLITRLIWSRWGANVATAKGAAHDCVPDCAVGHFHIYRGVRVVLTRPRSCSAHLRLFTRITVTFTKNKPDSEPRRSRQPVPFGPQPHCP